MLQGFVRVALAVTVVVLAVVPDTVVTAITRSLGAEVTCPPRDTRVTTPYPITGYWVIPRPDRCVTQRLVEAVHGVGGDTIITFGARILPAEVDGDGRVTGDLAGDFAGCVENGKPCYRAALEAAPGRTIGRVYTYLTTERFGDAVLRCPGLDRRIESGGRTYYRLMLGGCDAGRHDLLLIAADGDGVGNLLAEAAAYGMRVFPGLPVPPRDPGKPWLPDLAHLPALNELTARVLADYRQRYATSAALGGVYQSFELAMRDRADDDAIIALYAAQHEVVAAAMPGTKIMVSPFWDARRGRGFPVEQVGKGFADIAGTRAGAPMAIAIQDGRGVGKVPVYGADEVDASVGPRLAPMVGERTHRQAYHGSTRDYVAEAARHVEPGVELWVNVEVFEPTQAAGECGRANPFPLRGRATKSRVDEQVAAVGGNATKIIAYGWDPFLTCRSDDATPSLSDDLAADWRQPIIADARWTGAGITVEGYRLGGGDLRFTYQARGAGTRTVTVPQQRHAPRTGDADRASDGGDADREPDGGDGDRAPDGGDGDADRVPGGLESAWAPFAPGDLDPARPWITITATDGAGHTSTGGYAFDGGTPAAGRVGS
ncbi:hypothetical protein LDL08_05730 [Nonomuraea glycinis]|uniref:DUF4434 domain-containing protein n=1 Tax=Nonomuraea glycinis TaxID=2047744 RepID=A0A918A543_9ACTN|nr:DUF4434 domain-containing protein [Nonomuraea glycinis]MCA2175681.1 hypothetical protein [Nonomuraea glycinis]GGP05171.1 hypothetical protein GCM10012278_23520 [Nonomuraea glycinis]